MTQAALTVSQLNQTVSELLSSAMPLVLVEGEISNFSRPGSGHWYFSLKDSKAQVRSAMFRNRNRLMRVTPKEGMQVLVRARVSLYAPRGDYQLIVEHIEEAGEGALRRQYEERLAKLSAEGLFEPSHKKELPAYPQTIGIITSPTGAAVRDVLHTLARRYPLAKIIIFPAQVQGEQAAPQLCQAIHSAQHFECDILILTRGGGSLEDLWAFNDEALARTIFASQTPIIAGIGHETDTTIAEFVADVRAPTPTAAAEMASPESDQLQQQLYSLAQDLHDGFEQRQQQLQYALTLLEQKLQSPEQQLQTLAILIDQKQLQLEHRLHKQLQRCQQQAARLQQQLLQTNPQQKVMQQQQLLQQLSHRFAHSMQTQLERNQQRLGAQSHQLQAVSPLATLARGYSIATDMHGNIIRDVAQVKQGDTVTTQLAKGEFNSVIE